MKFGWSRWDHWKWMQSLLICQEIWKRIVQILLLRDLRCFVLQSPTRFLLQLWPQIPFQKLVSKWVSWHSVETVRGQRMHLCPRVVLCRSSQKRRTRRYPTWWSRCDFLSHVLCTTTSWPWLITCIRELPMPIDLRRIKSCQGGTDPGSHEWHQRVFLKYPLVPLPMMWRDRPGAPPPTCRLPTASTPSCWWKMVFAEYNTWYDDTVEG